MEKKSERRKSRRFDWAWPISVTSGDREVARGCTANISRSGALFHSRSPLPLRSGMTVDVRIGVPAGAGPVETIEASAHVVRLEDNPGSCGVALHFTKELDALPGAPSAPQTP